MSKKITLIASLDNERFKGGIYTIAHHLLKRKDLWAKAGYSLEGVSSCQLHSRKLSNLGKFRFENIKNVVRVIRAIVLSEKKESSYGFYMMTSTGLGFLKDLVVASYIKRRWKNKKMVLNVQFSEMERILPRHTFLKKLSIGLLKYSIDSLFVLNGETARHFKQLGFNKHIGVISNFYIPAELLVQSANHSQKLALLYLGMMDKRKGFDKLLEIMKELPAEGVVLHVCGGYLSEHFRKEMEQYIEEHQLAPRIQFHGFVEGEEKERIIQQCDVLMLLTSGEGMAMALLEAMHRKLTVITTHIASNRAVFQATNIELHEVDDLEGIRRKIVRYMEDKQLLESDKDTCFELSKKYSVEAQVHELTKIFDVC